MYSTISKNLDEDRQIGDCRGRNFCECHLPGPSQFLPAGSDLLDLYVEPRHLRVYCTDRKDFYHQFWTTAAKARANAVGPAVPLSSLRGLAAFDKGTGRRLAMDFICLSTKNLLLTSRKRTRMSLFASKHCFKEIMQE